MLQSLFLFCALLYVFFTSQIYTQSLCILSINDKIQLQFYCNSQIKDDTWKYQLLDENQSIKYMALVYAIKRSPETFCDRPTLISNINHQLHEFIPQAAVDQKYAAYTYLTDKHALAFRSKNLLQIQNNNLIHESHVFGIDSLILFIHFVYWQVSSYHEIHQKILSSLQLYKKNILGNNAISFSIESSCSCLRAEQSLVDKYLNQVVVYNSLDCNTSESDYLLCPHLVIKDLKANPMPLGVYADSIYATLEKDINVKIYKYDKSFNEHGLSNVHESYLIQYKTVIVDRLKVRGDKQVEEWLIASPRYKMHITWNFPCNIGLANCFDENKQTNLFGFQRLNTANFLSKII
jgi:hypothetical protein